MAKNLVIVESPAKARTIEKYLGNDFEVLASYGHVRDLVPKEGAVDPDNGFAMKYQLIDKNEKHVDKIVKAAKKASAVYLATDPDREGEAISWHVYEVLKERKVLDSQVGAARRVPRGHETRDPRSHRAAARSLRAARQRAAGAARARLSGRLQSVAAALEEGAARAVRGPRAKPGAAPHRRARGRDHGVQGAGILDDRSDRRAGRASVSGSARRLRAARRSSSSRSPTETRSAPPSRRFATPRAAC